MINILRKVRIAAIIRGIYALFIFCFLFSCSNTKNISSNYKYFVNGSDTVNTVKKETIIQPNDILGIQVYSRTLNQEQAAIFNIFATSTTAASQGYQVDLAGNIEMPVIGKVKAMGLTKFQLQALLVDKITNFVKEPSVIVKFLDFNINVLGEVRSGGTKKFLQDKVTIIDALSAAGDLTDFGKREDITVIRELNGKKVYYTVDMRSKNVFASPVYVLQPNDIVYVAPNKKKLKNLNNTDTEIQQKVGFFTTFLGIAVTITTLFLYLKK